jgi:hypothetical protein
VQVAAVARTGRATTSMTSAVPRRFPFPTSAPVSSDGKKKLNPPQRWPRWPAQRTRRRACTHRRGLPARLSVRAGCGSCAHESQLTSSTRTPPEAVARERAPTRDHVCGQPADSARYEGPVEQLTYAIDADRKSRWPVRRLADRSRRATPGFAAASAAETRGTSDSRSRRRRARTGPLLAPPRSAIFRNVRWAYTAHWI